MRKLLSYVLMLAINLPVYAVDIQFSPVVVQPNVIGGTITGATMVGGTSTGSAATLATPRAINGVNFDGSAPISIQAPPPYADATGTGDAITASYPSVTSGLVDGLTLSLGASAANTLTNPTFAPTLGGVATTPHTIVKGTGSALIAGDIPGATAQLILVYNLPSTSWYLINPVAIPGTAAAGTLTGNTLAAGVTASSLTSFGAAPAIGAATGTSLDATTRVSVGGQDNLNVGGAVLTPQIQVNSDTIGAIESHTHSNTAAIPGAFVTARARGTLATPLIVSNGDTIGRYAAVGYNGVDYEFGGYLDFVLNGTVSATAMPTKMNFYLTPAGSLTPGLAASLDASGVFSASTYTSTVATGTAPFAVTSTTPVANLSIGGNAATATTATNLSGGAGGTIPYQSAAGSTAMLANGTAGQLLQSNGTTLAPSWSSAINGVSIGATTPSTGAFTTINASGGYTQSGTSANTFTGTSTFSNAIYSAIFTGGSVGIGTTLPLTRTHIKGATAPSLGGIGPSLLSLETTDLPAIDAGPQIAFGGRSGNGVDPYSFAYIKGAKESVAAGDYSGYLALKTVNSIGSHFEWVRITSTGNVGVGTTNPQQTLSVAGNISATAGITTPLFATGAVANQLRTAQTTAPTCTTNCGTGGTVVGTDTAGKVTIGATGTPASGVLITFNGTWAAAPACTAVATKAGMTAFVQIAVATTTTLTLDTAAAPANSDTYSYNCIGVQ